MRIVYVEDNPANIALVERISKMNHDDLMVYTQPDEALTNIEPGASDLILMDVNLGETVMNGLELTKLLRAKGVSEPIVVITAYDAMRYSEHFHNADFNEYILKPVSVRSMIDLINAYRTS